VFITTLEYSDLVSRITQKSLGRFILAPNVNSTILLTASLRDTSTGIPTLRKIRRRVGWYLAIQHLTNITGLKEALCTHPNGTTGMRWRLRGEAKITIVGIVPNGDSMALGVRDALPMARFVRTLTLADISESHISAQKAVILVDSTIKKDDHTMLNAIKRIRTLHATIRIMVLTGEVLFDLRDHCHELVKLMNQQAVTLIALQASHQEELGA
jgi:uracil phosphoribosyltransferase